MNQLIQLFKNSVLQGLSLASVLVVTLTGCAAVSEGKGGQLAAVRLAAIKNREVTFNSTWRGQSYNALREVLGAPEQTLTNPNNPKMLILIYGVADDSSRCVDSFTVVNEVKKGQWSVMDYFCR